MKTWIKAFSLVESIFSRTGTISADGTSISSPGGLYKFRPNE